MLKFLQYYAPWTMFFRRGQPNGAHAIRPAPECSDLSDSLTVEAANTTTIGTLAYAFDNSPNGQVTLIALVISMPAPVNGGTFTFVVTDNLGNEIGQPVISDPVVNGQASAIFKLPAGIVPGDYTIHTAYSGSKNFNPSSNATGCLAVRRSPLLPQQFCRFFPPRGQESASRCLAE